MSHRYDPLVADSKTILDLFNIANKANELIENAINHWVRTAVGLGEMGKAWLNFWYEIGYRGATNYQGTLRQENA